MIRLKHSYKHPGKEVRNGVHRIQESLPSPNFSHDLLPHINFSTRENPSFSNHFNRQ